MPKRFLFCGNTGYGHFHPLVPLAQALKEAGHTVAFAMSPSHRTTVEAAGFAFFPLTINMAADQEYQQVKEQLAQMPLDLEYELYAYPRLFCGIATRLRMPVLLEIAREWQPDMFIREAGEYTAALAAEYLGLPHAVVAFAAALKGHNIFEREVPAQLAPTRHEWGLPPDPTLDSLYRYLHLSYSPPTFSKHDVDYSGEAKAIPSTTHFIRPNFFDQGKNETLPDWMAELPKQPTVYVTLGTEINKEPTLYPNVMQTLIAGLRDLPINLIATLGRDKGPSDFGTQPPNVHIEPYIPQSLLLPHCDLIVMHGGSNSLLAALDNGLPMVIVPLIADQFFNANVAQSLKLGQAVQLEQLTPGSIRAAVEEVLANPHYRQNVAQIQAEMHNLPDQSFAVGLIEQILAKH